ncbi:MAG: hypothetical protein GTO53_05340 [Planctomycetales bacterium]|nr:hypothetical protein [Planctomycetales bacterium]NIM08573.1 hypothetical protein [Planctomycetales bacterium]NIN08042.1 hypothetical protein [Planctomycetales bacterium]NIN77178.1 hypothetical protein [Planctomycetales bacterium]NIO34360.1 hypothetical protein [Planctomycetales bacterium]
MTERWLNPNRRVQWFAGILAATVTLAGVWLGWFSPGQGGLQALPRVLTVAGAAATLAILVQITRPRLGYRDGQLLVNLRLRGPLRVPIQHVECFFLGRSATPFALGAKVDARVATVVVRLSESASQWADRDVLPVLGKWTNGYITIYGTSCEPLDIQRVNQLNRRLREVQRGS